MGFNLPRKTIARVRDVDVRLDAGQHPFEAANEEAIEANWQAEVAANPALFDGRMMLLSSLELQGEHLTGRCHEVRYATLLHWRKHRAVAAEHAFAHAALISTDDCLVAIRMGAHTANPGAVYFAAGSFEVEDFVDGRCDPEANMVREVGEETGLDISALRREEEMHLFSLDSSTALFRRYWLDMTAAEAEAHIAAFVKGEAEPEIEGPVIIRRGAPMPEGIKPHMEAFVRWHFGQ